MRSKEPTLRGKVVSEFDAVHATNDFRVELLSLEKKWPLHDHREGDPAAIGNLP